MQNKYAKHFIFFICALFFSAIGFGQNISVNTTGAANGSLSMLEILQISTTADTKGLFISHTGAVTTGSGIAYGLRSEVTGGSTTNIAGYFAATGSTNKYAIVVPAGGGNVGIGTTTPCSLSKLEVVGDNQISGVRPANNTAYASLGAFSDSWCASLSGTTLGQYGSAVASSNSVLSGIADAGIGILDFYNLSTYAIVATSNSIPMLFGTNKLERMRIAAAGQVGINMTPSMQLDVTSSSTTVLDAAIRGAATGAAQVYGVEGNFSSASNDGGGVWGIATGNARVFGVLGQISNSTTANAAGVRGQAVQATGATFGVWGENASNNGNSAAVYGNASSASGAVNGVWGTIASTSAGATAVYGNATGATGATFGVLGTNSSTGGFGVYGSSSGNGINYGVYGVTTSTTNGTGWSSVLNKTAGVFGKAGTGASTYQAGVFGFQIGSGLHSGGVVGAYSATTWGALGYTSASSTVYGVYGADAGANTWGSGAGRMASSSVEAPIDIAAGIGGGFAGSLMGGWMRGGIYGMNIKGERYSLYVDGKSYTNDIITQVSDNGTSERNVTYVSTSTSVDVYARGSGRLENGKTTISFDRNYSSQLSSQEKVMITITPVGPSNGVYATGISSRGFTVIENNDGKSNVEFSWIAVGVRKGYEKPEHPKEILSSDYDQNMKGVMFNENDTKSTPTPIWWDGTQLRFDAHPIFKKEEGNLDLIKPLNNVESTIPSEKQSPK